LQPGKKNQKLLKNSISFKRAQMRLVNQNNLK
jgi:hypothetical protein